MEGLPNWQVYGVPAVYIIVAVVNWLKESFNLENKWAFPVATGLGLVVGGLMWLSENYAWALAAVQILLGAVLLGLSASGLYSLTKYNYIKTTEREVDEAYAAYEASKRGGDNALVERPR